MFAYIVDSSPEELQSAIDITLRRFAEYFQMLRTHSQRNGHKIVDIAQAIVESHLLLLPPLAERQPSAGTVG